MAIETLQVVHTDLQVRGGLKNIAIADVSDITAATYGSDTHTISAVSDATAKMFDLKLGTGSLSSSGSKENGSIMFENTISFYVPNMSLAHYDALISMIDLPIAVWAEDYNDAVYCIGISQKYNESSDFEGHQMYAKVTSVEGSTGAALGDESGVTVTISAMEGELPRLFTGTYTPAANGTVTIS
jgi:hypothetical protein